MVVARLAARKNSCHTFGSENQIMGNVEEDEGHREGEHPPGGFHQGVENLAAPCLAPKDYPSVPTEISQTGEAAQERVAEIQA